MTNLNSNTLLWIVIGIIIIIAVIYLVNNNNKPIQNEGILPSDLKPHPKKINAANLYQKKQVPTVSDSIINDIIAGCSPAKSGVSGVDPLSSDHGPFTGYVQKKHQKLREQDHPFEDNSADPRDFVYKKQKYTRRTPEDVRDLFDVDKMLPQEREEDWFDDEPLMTTKKIKGTHMIHPKVHMGVNTVSGSLRNGTHDIRGDIINPKIPVSPWGNSTIEPDTNLKGVCYKQ